MKKYLCCIIIVISACGTDNIVENARIEYVKSRQTVMLERDSSFTHDFSQVLSCVDVITVADSVLLLYDRIVQDGNTRFYKAYSLEDYSFLGEYVSYGRGPGEFLSPDMSGEYRSEEENRVFAYIFDIMLCQSYGFDLYESIAERQIIVKKISDWPSNILYAAPYRDSLHFIMDIEKDRLLCHLANSRSVKLQSYNLYNEDVSAERSLSQLSNCVNINHEKGIVALAMIGIPQINFLNLRDGRIHSVAVDRQYRNWRKLISAAYNMKLLLDSKEYYTNTVSTSEYVIALYTDMTIGDIINRTGWHSPHIHIFNWDGKLMYDFAISENITKLAYDKSRKMLYGLDVNESRIYRYDLADIL